MNWFKRFQRQNSLTNDRQLNISANLASFSRMTAFQSGVCSLIANLHTKAAECNEVREMFLKLDVDNDGFLTHDELEAGMAEIAQIFSLDVPDVRSMLRSADINGDGRIDYTEFMAAAYQKDLLLSTENL